MGPNVYGLLGAVFVGLIGAVGMLVYERLQQTPHRHSNDEYMQTRRDLEDIKKDIDQLKKRTQDKPDKRKKEKSRSSGSMKSDDFWSAKASSVFDWLNDINSNSSENEHEFEETRTVLVKNLYDMDLVLESSSLQKIQHALTKLRNLLNEYPKNWEILWRIGKAHFLISVRTEVAKIHNIEKGIDVCLEALKINTQHAEIHKWLSSLFGAKCEETSATSDKIKYGKLSKEHLDRALELKPIDPVLHHFLGRFSYEVAALTGLERWYAKLPNVTYADAFKHFEKSEKYANKETKENNLMLAKCNIAMKQYKQAAKLLKKAEMCVHLSNFYVNAESETKTLLHEYKCYL